jgi:hypothetical protein
MIRIAITPTHSRRSPPRCFNANDLFDDRVNSRCAG